jgi:hypothetical protein
MPGSDQPTVFHITHWKAGSQWVRAVLHEAMPGRYIRVEGDLSNIRPDQLRPGAVYTPVYLPAHGFKEFVPESLPQRRFVVIRDLRDTLVSWYFSVKHSHGRTDALTDSYVLSYRERFDQCSEEEGLIVTLKERLDPIVRIQRSWLRAGELVVRYEDMLADEHGAFKRIFDHCGLDVDPRVRADAVARHSFENRTGRKRGEEDLSAHHRKGVAGDWRNHFTPRVTDAFKERLGQALLEAGYEQSMDW